MAGLKKKKKEKSGSPNTVLVVFLVLFILVSIGLGVWGYYGYAGQEELRTKAFNAGNAERATKNHSDFLEGWLFDLREGLNQTTAEEAQAGPGILRDELYKAGSLLTKDKQFEAAKKSMEELHEMLGLDKGVKGYEKTIKTLLGENNAKITILSGDLAKSLQKNIRVEKEVAKQNDKQDASNAKAMAEIVIGNKAALKAAEAKTDEFAKQLEENNKRQKIIEELSGALDAAKADHVVELNKLNRKLKELAAEMREMKAEGMRGMINAARADSAPLLLDITQGKPLWDAPVGKVIRVEPDLRTVTINLGSAQGVKPELTFNIFAAGTGNRASGALKGSIEVVRVVDSSTSIARVTSLYDAEGREIGFNEPSRSRLSRQAEAPLKEGDLLFNLFWGARVAVTGYVAVTGEMSDNPAEQIKQTQDFLYLLQRQGMIVDSYVDLSDGQVKGTVSGKTRYLIRGADLRGEQGKPAPKADADDEKKDADAPGGGRIEAINKAGRAMRQDATDKGVLIVSAENFAVMIGYRRPHSANRDEKSGFEPRLPFAGTNVGPINPAAAPAPAEPKKDADMKKDN